MNTERIKRFRENFSFWGITHFLITNPADIFYFTGFHGEDSAVLVGPRSVVLYTDGRYTAEVAQKSSVRCIESRKKNIDARDAAYKKDDALLGYDGDTMTHSDFLHLKKGIPLRRLHNLTQPTSHLRSIKDAGEIKLMQKAVQIAEKAFCKTAATFKTGMKEADIAASLEYNMRMLGADSPSFDTIAAIGSNAALPHATPSQRKIPKNGLLLMDFGARFKGYDSDQTRMIIFGTLPKKQQEVLALVQASQDAAVATIKPGVLCKDVDTAAREVISAAGYAEAFKHGTGHGVGIDIHEAPGVGARSNTVLKEGMVITVEPGIYLEGSFGVRLEEMILVTKNGAKRLTSLPMIMHAEDLKKA